MTVGLVRRALPVGRVVQYIVAQVLGGIAGAAITMSSPPARRTPPLAFRHQRLWRSIAWQVWHDGGVGHRDRPDLRLRDGDLNATDAKGSHPRLPAWQSAFALTLIHLVSIPVTNTSVNPARSTAPALFVGGPALSQLWLFWVAPWSAAPGGSPTA